MTTEPVDSRSAAPTAVMWTIGEIADRDRISKQAVSKKVSALVDHHALEVRRDGRGRISAVNVAQYDHLRERYGDATKAQAPRHDSELPLTSGSAGAMRGGQDSLEEAQRQRAWIDAERARMRLAAERRELVSAASFDSALIDCAAEIARIIDRLTSSTDEIAAAIGRDGAHGVRVLLKSIAHKMRDDVANALLAIAAGAPELEELPEQQEGPPVLACASEQNRGLAPPAASDRKA